MKTILFLGLFSVVVLHAFSQNLSTASSNQNIDYLQKSRDQRTTAWVLLGGGAALAFIGIAWNSDESTNDGFFTQNFDTQAALMLIGGASAVASVPFFIASSRNKEKSRKMSLNLNIQNNNAKQFNGRFKKFPALSFAVPLGR